MRLDHFIQKLLPHDEMFYTYFEQATQNLVRAADLLKQLILETDPAIQKSLVDRIKDVEHDGDDVAHKIFSELNATFVTPFDREDIHHLTSSLDDILDQMNGCAGRITLYKINEIPESMHRLIDILRYSIKELDRGVTLLRKLHESDELQQVFKKVNEYENDADDVFEVAIADLFEKEKDPIRIIKLKEVFVGLETATDKCEDAANVLEGIYIKHA
ncbi:MAG: DUF47 family protein [bacterium]